MSVVGPEVMLNKYNLEFKKMAIPVALQSHCGTSWEIQVLQPNRSWRERSSVEMRAAPALAGVVRRGGSGAHTVRPAGGPAHRRVRLAAALQQETSLLANLIGFSQMLLVCFLVS